MSSRQTPSSRSSAESVHSAAASDSSTASVTSSPARLAQVTVLCSALPEQVAMCRSTSRRVPTIPTGSKMPACSSRMNWRGSRCRISRSAGRSMARARSTAARTSSLRNLAHAPAQLDSAARVQAANVRAAHAHYALVNIDARHAFRALAGHAHCFCRRRQFGDQALAHPRRFHNAVAAIAQHVFVHIGHQNARLRAADVEHHNHVVLLLSHCAHPPCSPAAAGRVVVAELPPACVQRGSPLWRRRRALFCLRRFALLCCGCRTRFTVSPPHVSAWLWPREGRPRTAAGAGSSAIAARVRS